MENFIGKRCQHCDNELQITDNVHICSDCGASYHQACWEENGGCSTPGCSEHVKTQAESESSVETAAPAQEQTQADIEAAPAKPNAFCQNCGSPLNPGEAFCQRCGRPVADASQPSFTCLRCGTPVNSGEAFCSKCGQPVGVFAPASAPVPGAAPVFQQPDAAAIAAKRKKTTIIIVSIVAAVLVLLIGIGVTVTALVVQGYQKEMATQDYIDNAIEIRDEILKSGGGLENIGNEVLSNWYDYINYDDSLFNSVDDAVDTAFDTMAAEVSTVQSNDSYIQNLYSSLSNVPNSGDSNLYEIGMAVDTPYSAYSDLSDRILNAEGSYRSFNSEFGRIDDEAVEAYNTLDDLLYLYE